MNDVNQLHLGRWSSLNLDIEMESLEEEDFDQLLRFLPVARIEHLCIDLNPDHFGFTVQLRRIEALFETLRLVTAESFTFYCPAGLPCIDLLTQAFQDGFRPKVVSNCPDWEVPAFSETDAETEKV